MAFCRSGFLGALFLGLTVCCILSGSCSRPLPRGGAPGGASGGASGGALPPGQEQELLGQFTTEADTEAIFSSFLRTILENAEIPPALARPIEAAAATDPAFILDLLICLEGDPFLRRLVDKKRPLPAGYEPADLVELGGGSYGTSRRGLLLRRAAEEALEEMAAAGLVQGITLIASSAYRSFAYQEEVYARNVRDSGQETADRESARPGFSQHQTGLVVDFGSIDDSFARTQAGRWLTANAGRFGWSLSFPEGYEALTGYRWESWHYRYLGRDLCAFTETWFGGIQQYALQFIHAWEAAEL